MFILRTPPKKEKGLSQNAPSQINYQKQDLPTKEIIEEKLKPSDLSFDIIDSLYNKYNSFVEPTAKLKAYYDISEMMAKKKDGVVKKSEELYNNHKKMIKEFFKVPGSSEYYRNYSGNLTSFGDFKKMADSFKNSQESTSDVVPETSSNRGSGGQKSTTGLSKAQDK
jgi:hypothetical protein